MGDKPILFSGTMVRAILNGSKTQTRRTIKLPDWATHIAYDAFHGWRFNSLDHSEPLRLRIDEGDRLWVRESWRPLEALGAWDVNVLYQADLQERLVQDGEFGERDWRWPKAAAKGFVPSLHMPRWASRLTLTVTDVRVERLQNISRGDAMDEGCPLPNMAAGPNPRDWYAALWDEINGPGSWETNPWVAAYTFTVQRGNIDQLAGQANG